MFKHMVELTLPALSCSGSIKQIFFYTNHTDGNPRLKLAEHFGLELQNNNKKNLGKNLQHF